MSSSYKGHWINGSPELGYTFSPKLETKHFSYGTVVKSVADAKRYIDAMPAEQLRKAGYVPRRVSKQLREGRYK